MELYRFAPSLEIRTRGGREVRLVTWLLAVARMRAALLRLDVLYFTCKSV